MINEARSAIRLQHFPPRDRFEVWRSALQPLYSVSSPHAVAPRTFEGDLSVVALADCCLVTCASEPQTLARDLAARKCASWDHVVVQLNEMGTSTGDGLRACPGDVHLLDLGQMFRQDAGRFKHIALIAPRERLAGDKGCLFHGSAIDRSGPLRDVVARHMRAIAENAAAFTAAEASLVVDALFVMLAKTHVAAWTPPACASLRETVCRHIDRNLHDPNLDPERIAVACRMSRATLYRLFAGDGGVAAFLAKQRLDRAFTLMVSPQAKTRISTIAHRCGFKSDVHFSRAFKGRFGLTPRAVRDGAVPSDAGHEIMRSPYDWIRSMRHLQGEDARSSIPWSSRDIARDCAAPEPRSGVRSPVNDISVRPN